RREEVCPCSECCLCGQDLGIDSGSVGGRSGDRQDLQHCRAVARVSLVPQKREFFVLYSRAARNTVEIARLLLVLLEAFPRTDGLLRDIKELEHEGDRLTREVV